MKHLTDIVIDDNSCYMRLATDLVAKAVTKLRYDALSRFLRVLGVQLREDARRDEDAGRVQLADRLLDASLDISKAAEDIDRAWKISKPYDER